MKNNIICENCNTENTFYKSNCTNCKAYLRTKITNIDFWNTLWLLLESPKKAFSNIIFSEHKNFMVVLTLLLPIKFFINVLILSNAIKINTNTLDYILPNFLLSILYSIIIFILFCLFVYLIQKLLDFENRFMDNLAIYIYSLAPIIIGGILLFPLNYALFGNYFLSFTPSPFLLKTNVAYILTGLEVILILWSLILAILATYTHTKSKIYSIFIGIGLIASIFAAIIYLPYFPNL